ncbi:hypothetical protein C8R43DRAFT_215233 [Mycena crocata]|nr:hypothetical protein C8R43DRAFT_215233 [Mycena crocata]
MRDQEKGATDTNSLGTDQACAKMWSVYVSQAEKYDNALVAGWRADMKGILIFVRTVHPIFHLITVPQAGLFSASLTAFIIESYQTLTPDTAVVILAQISLHLNASTAPPLEFTPTTSALVCNGLWFTSLGLSLACAVIATLVEQWARDYLNKSDMRPAPIERARICSYLYSGLKHFRMHAVVDLIPLLLHMSLLLFFAGLVAFLHPINRAMMVVAACLLVIVTFVYAALTVMPLLFANCPCRTPLSGVLWRVGQICLLLPSTLRNATHPKVNHSMEEVMMRRATVNSVWRDKRALCWTLKSLTAEHELEPFVEAIPQVIWSWKPFMRRRDHDPLLQTLINDPGVQLASRIAALLLSCESGLLERNTREHRTVLCLKALLAFALAAEVGPHRSLAFPFEISTFEYLEKNDYGPAQPYLPALRACGAWSVFCSLFESAETLVSTANTDTQLDFILPNLQMVVYLQSRYLRARGVQGRPELDELMSQIVTHGSGRFRMYGDNQLCAPLQRLIDSKLAVQLDIFCGFLLDSARRDHEPYNFKESVEILRPRRVMDPDALPSNLIFTFQTIVDNLKNDPVVNHVDRAAGLCLPLFDCIPDNTETEQRATDALIVYLNGRNLSDAVLRVLRDCNVALVWSRVTRRLHRRDQPDDVLTAVWRLCDLFLDLRFSAQLSTIPLQSFIDAASTLPAVSQYTASADALLRTVALHAAETIHIPAISHGSSSIREHSLAQLKALRTTLPLLTSTGELDIDQLRSRINKVRLALLTEFMDACPPPIRLYNVARSRGHSLRPSSPARPVLRKPPDPGAERTHPPDCA